MGVDRWLKPKCVFAVLSLRGADRSGMGSSYGRSFEDWKPRKHGFFVGFTSAFTSKIRTYWLRYSELTVTSLAIWGILIQNVAFDVIIPIYLLIHLSTSPTVSSNDPNDFHIDLPNLSTIPFSMAIGYILPTILAALPSPSVISFDHTQTFLAIWQFFPLWVQLLQYTLPYLTAVFQPLPLLRNSNLSRHAALGPSRVVYIFTSPWRQARTSQP